MSCSFPDAVSYNRFVELKSLVWQIQFIYVWKKAFEAEYTGIYFIDSLKLEVCHNLRRFKHKVFANLASGGKSSIGWFFGLKLHTVINHKGQVVRFVVSPGNTADNDKWVLQKLLSGLKGKCFGDKGYLSKMFPYFYAQGIELFAKARKNMKNKVCHLQDILLSKKRGVIESVFRLLKFPCDIMHSRHRSPVNAFENIFAALAAYSFFDRKPKISNFLCLN